MKAHYRTTMDATYKLLLIFEAIGSERAEETSALARMHMLANKELFAGDSYKNDL